MKLIIKAKEPKSLLEHRLQPFADYDNYPHKDELRASLLSEQGYICCYCMQRIQDDKMKIEHWRSQDEYPDLQLDYNNLLGACEGGQGLPKHLQHCDTKKGNAVLTINPLDSLKNCENVIKYHLNGQMYSDDIMINEELNKILNLNVQILKENRKKILDVLIQTLKSERPKGDWTAAMLNNKIREWSNKDEDNKYKAYCQIVIYYLKKKLSKLN
ncbi:hypothetical protein CAL7716_054210 [Calothrix sp. PCC 7716]|nr:hypothetical protein CAL7716_054210 [Calothrix sp. PCC 7716]